MKITNTFYCRKLGCAGYTYNACLTRRQSKMPNSSKNFKYPACAECEQGNVNKAKFAKWKYTKPSKRTKPDRISLRTFKEARVAKKVELSSKKSASEMEKIGITPDIIGDSTTTFTPEIGKMFDFELFVKGQCSYIFSLLREGKKTEAKERVALVKKELGLTIYGKQFINDILKEAI